MAKVKYGFGGDSVLDEGGNQIPRSEFRTRPGAPYSPNDTTPSAMNAREGSTGGLTPQNVWANLFRNTPNSTYVSSFGSTTSSPTAATMNHLNNTLDTILNNPFDQSTKSSDTLSSSLLNTKRSFDFSLGGNYFTNSLNLTNNPASAIASFANGGVSHLDQWTNPQPQQNVNPAVAEIKARQARESTVPNIDQYRPQVAEQPQKDQFSWGSAY